MEVREIGTWVWAALLSALFASATAILAKIGIEGVNSNLATAIRTAVILVFAWGIVVAQGHLSDVTTLSRRTWIFLGLSGLATGLSWLFYFYALKIGPVARVATLDKLSLAFTLVLSIVILREQASPQLFIGIAMMIGGAIFTTLRF